MQHLKDKILHIIKQYPKLFVHQLKKDSELYPVIDSYHGNTFSEKVYNFLYPGNNICPRGNTKIFNSINNGYRFCGKAGTCHCAKEAVSKKCKESKQNYSDEEKSSIKSKREKTNIKKYGVANTGQLQSAIDTREQLYSDKEKVVLITDKVKSTKLKKYGNENYNNSQQIIKTWKERYDTDYWIDRTGNENFAIIHDQEQFTKLFYSNSPEEIAELMGVHVQTIYRYANIYGLRDPYKSLAELEIEGYLNSIGITNIIRNTRKLLGNGKEIDFYLPEHNLAIEYNGTHWHHEDVPQITRTYHHEKYKICEEKEIQLITIFSPFWQQNKNIIKTMLLNKLKINNNTIYARKCEIVQLSCKDIKQFLIDNHIQGYARSSINYGLVYNNDLVSVMTFSKCTSRVAIGKTEDGFELVRYASNHRVIGGASKLLKCFIQYNSPTRIISYSNNEWSDGNLYKTLGFTLETNIAPSYWYSPANGSKLLHRFNYSKQKLIKKGYDKNKSEREITREMKMLRIWDCGKKRWVLNIL